ncbi:hypothetical protein [Xenorhabdus sp. KK7.4]|nr:hypothetical protein [Xenorhabdus sp. KK7.4]
MSVEIPSEDIGNLTVENDHQFIMHPRIRCAGRHCRGRSAGLNRIYPLSH